MPESTSGPDEVAKVLEVTQTGVALAGALGVATIGSRVWAWLNRTPDEAFLVALTTHAATFERARVLSDPPDWADQHTRRQLKRISQELAERANWSIRRSIAQRDWARSLWAGIGPVGFAVGVFMLMLTIPQLSSDKPADWTSATFSIGLVAMFASLLIGLFVKEIYMAWRMKQLERDDLAEDNPSSEDSPPSVL